MICKMIGKMRRVQIWGWFCYTRAAAWVAKAAVKAVEAQAKKDAMNKYEQYMVVWRD